MDEQQVVRATLSVTMDGQAYSLPVLKIKAADKWLEKVTKAFGAMEKLEGLSTQAAMNMPAKKILDLVVAYDTTNVLGGLAHIEENATSEDVYDAFLLMWRKSFPFGRLATDLMTAVNPLAPARSQNGLSLIGDLTPTA